MWMGPFLSSVTLNHPMLTKEITNTQEPKDELVYRFMRPWIGDGLLVSKGKKWARNRKLLTPAFHFDILKPYVKIFNESTKTMLSKWREQLKTTDSLDMFEVVSLLTLDSLLKCTFGYESNCQIEEKRNPYIKAVYDLSDLAIKRFRFLPHHSDLLYYFSWNGYKFRRACKVVHDYSRGVVTKRKEVLKELKERGESPLGKRKYLDFLDILLETKDEEGNGLTDEEIQHEVDTFLFEGHDTTASGITWCLYNLARHPEYLEKCREEVNDVLQGRDELVWEDLSNVPFLTMCIKESLRLHPPVPNIARVLTKPLTFPDGRTLPAGMWVGIGIYGVHHNPEVWDNPLVYDPSRFTPENSKNRSPHAFIPFSAGPRNCIGQNFAMNEMKIAIALIIKHFNLEVDESKPVSRIPELVLRSKGGLWLKPKSIQ